MNKFKDLEKVMDIFTTKGAFMTVKSGDKLNTMTIGWGSVAYMWKKNVFIAMVRKSRYTYELLQQNDEFTVSVPINEDLQKALVFCGTKSGRDYDKFKECGLGTATANTVSVPVIAGGGYTFECKTLFTAPLSLELLPEEIKSSCYPTGDEHILYFAEITDAYTL